MKPKNQILTLLAISSLASGAVDQYFYPGQEWPPTYVVFTVICAFLIFFWYRLDSDENGYNRSPGLNVAIVGIAFLALPYYFFRSRGAKRGAISTVYMLAAFIGSVLLSTLGLYAIYYGLQA